MASSDNLIPLRYKNFRGYNSVDDHSLLTPNYLVSGSRDIDLTRKRGALAKRRGILAIIDSLGAGGVKGIHPYRRSSGDRILFIHGTDWYKVAGSETTLVKTSQADFDAGTLTNVASTTGGTVVLSLDSGSLALDQSEEVNNNSSAIANLAQTFTTGVGVHHIGEIQIKIPNASWIVGEDITLKMWTWDTNYATTVAAAPIGTKTVIGPQNAGWVAFTFSSPIPVSASTVYLFGFVVSAGSVDVNFNSPGAYAGGAAYYAGIASPSDMTFKVYKVPYYATGTWESPTYDLNNTPVDATLAWTTTIPSNTAITFYARGSNDNTSWGDWQVVESSGDGIPLTQYVKIKCILETADTAVTPTLSDFTITYETELNQAVSIQGSLSGNKGRMADYEDVCYLAESGRPKRYDGTAVRDVGVDPPETAPTVAVGTATGLSGTYKAAVTFVNDYGAESNSSSEDTVTVSNEKINWSDIPIGPTGTVSRKLYRTEAGGDTFYYVTTIEDNTTTVYTGDNLSDAAIVVLPQLETDNDIPPNSTIITEHLGYMLYVSTTNPSRLYHSKRDLPDSVPAAAYKSLPGPILAVGSYQGHCIVGGLNFVSAVIGDIWSTDPSINNTEIITISKEIGPVSQEAMVECSTKDGDILIFPTRKGLSFLSPGLQENSLRSTPLSANVQDIFDDAVNLENMAAINDRERYILTLNYYDEDAPIYINNRVLILDLRRMEFSPPWYVNASGIISAYGNLYIGDSSIGRVHQFDTGYDDNGSSINAVAIFPTDTTMFGSNLKKQFVQSRVVVSEGSNTTSLLLKPNVDGIQTILAPEATTESGWENTRVSPKMKLNLPRGYLFQMRIEDDSIVDWIIEEVLTEHKGGK